MKKYLFIALAAFSFLTLSQSCKKKVKDADIKADIEAKIKSTPEMAGLTASVTDGVVTLNGTCSTEACKASCQKTIEGMKGVKSVTSNVTVPQPAPMPAPPTVNTGDAMAANLADALKSYPTVQGTVKDGVVTLTGTISKDSWMKLKQALDKMHPKNVDPKGLTIK